MKLRAQRSQIFSAYRSFDIPYAVCRRDSLTLKEIHFYNIQTEVGRFYMRLFCINILLMVNRNIIVYRETCAKKMRLDIFYRTKSSVLQT